MSGDVSMMDPDQLPYYGEAQRRRKDEEIERLLQESYMRALTIVKKNRRLLLRLAQVAIVVMGVMGRRWRRERPSRERMRGGLWRENLCVIAIM